MQNILKSSFNLVLKKKVTQRIIIINEYVYPYLQDHGVKRGSAYRIANACGVAVPGPKHHSERDVVAIQRALKAIGYSPERFMEPPPKASNEECLTEPLEKANPWVAENAPYQYDVKAKLIHKKGCSAIPADAELKGYKDLNAALGKSSMPFVLIALQRRLNKPTESATRILSTVPSTTSSTPTTPKCSIAETAG